MNTSGATKKGKRVSIASKDVLDIQPIVYSFKGPLHSHASGSVATAARPPQWLYHDHVMGVIWMIFHKEKNYVGISQLQWCLKFLLDLKNSQGEYTGDVEICIQAIQDDLIEQYAKLGPALEKSMEDKSSLKERQSTVVAEDVGSAVNEEPREKYERSETIVENTESTEPINTDLNDSPINNNNNNNNNNGNNEEGDADDSFMMPPFKGITGTSTPKEEEPQTSQKESKNAKKHPEKHCGSTCKANDAKKKKEEMLSFTYDEMLSRGPAPCAEPFLVQNTFNDQAIAKLIDHSIEHRGEDLDPLADMNTSDVTNYLNITKQKHVERINKDMETLRILERLLENMNVIDTPANSTEDWTRLLGNLRTEDIDRQANEITKFND